MQYIAERITVDKDLMNGKPSIRGMRVTVQTVLDFLGAGDTPEEILEQYPYLEKEDIFACLKFAAQNIHSFPVIRKVRLKKLLDSITKNSLHCEV